MGQSERTHARATLERRQILVCLEMFPLELAKCGQLRPGISEQNVPVRFVQYALAKCALARLWHFTLLRSTARATAERSRFQTLHDVHETSHAKVNIRYRRREGFGDGFVIFFARRPRFFFFIAVSEAETAQPFSSLPISACVMLYEGTRNEKPPG